MVNQTCLTWATSWPCPALLTCGQTGPQAVTPSLCSPLSRGDLKGPAGDRPHSVVTWGGGPLNAVVHSGHALPAQPPLQPPGLRRQPVPPGEAKRTEAARPAGLRNASHPASLASPAPALQRQRPGEAGSLPLHFPCLLLCQRPPFLTIQSGRLGKTSGS